MLQYTRCPLEGTFPQPAKRERTFFGAKMKVDGWQNH